MTAAALSTCPGWRSVFEEKQMAKSKTQPEEVVEAEAEDFVEAGEAPPPPVPVGGNEPGEVPPSMR